MSVAEQVRDRIVSDWRNREVANWVIGNLTVLELGETHTQAPVLDLDWRQGPIQVAGMPDRDFLGSTKLVMSGGFEGNKGHISSVKYLHELRALYADDGMRITLLIEPDSYIRVRKDREPLVNQKERIHLWSTSGLVDAIIGLPEYQNVGDISLRYKTIHRLIRPAMWCANIENPVHFEIVTRDRKDILDIGRIVEHPPEAHSSFLSNTREMEPEQLQDALIKYSYELASEQSLGNTRAFVNISRVAEQMYKQLSAGMIE